MIHPPLETLLPEHAVPMSRFPPQEIPLRMIVDDAPPVEKRSDPPPEKRYTVELRNGTDVLIRHTGAPSPFLNWHWSAQP